MSFWGHSGVKYAQVAPSASFEFYNYLLSWGASVGETAVFSDFMGDQTSIQQMNMGMEKDEVREWLLGFDQAVLKHNMTMQMCMQLPSNLMQVYHFRPHLHSMWKRIATVELTQS